VRPRLNERTLGSISLFAIAPQPLLVLLGSLMTDIPDTDVFQLHREPRTWKWLDDDGPSSHVFKLKPPRKKGTGPVALVLSLSAPIAQDRVVRALGPSARVWELTIDAPDNDFLRSREQLAAFRRTMRAAYNRIKTSVGDGVPLHVFPAAPVAINVEVGRVRQPKADLPLVVYDSHEGTFTKALEIR
ncbi:MAG TPA: SAVED domain-containing protein, partial [Archangium sp.]